MKRRKLKSLKIDPTQDVLTFCLSSSYPFFFFFAGADPTHEGTAEGMENMADAVTHARFVGTDPASDEVVLMKILQVNGREQQLG